ncbi:hypothetical protein EPD83_017485 [Phycicoccus sp. CMS6Z-2]|nr:hypothetical protein [Phycicoccus flavus]
MTRSGLLWVRVRDDGGPGTAHAVWHVWHDPGDGPRAYVVSGPGEQHLPWLPDEVELVLRSKDSGGRLLTVPATATVLDPGSPAWDTAVEVLRPERLNATGDVVARWRERATVHALRPHGPALESPGHHDTGDGATPVRPAAPATVGRRPWHWRGRAGARRNTDR